MEEEYIEEIILEKRANETVLETTQNKINMCPYYMKVKCHFPRLTYSFCANCPKLAPIVEQHKISLVS